MIRKNRKRFFLSFALLTVYGVLMAIAGSSPIEDSPAVIFAWLIGTPVFAYLLGMLWQFDLVLRVREKKDEDAEQSSEKRKRERLDTVLRDLSDEDLVRLKRRLEDGVIDDDVLYEQMVGGDGELAHRN